MSDVLAADIGGTNLRLARVRPDGCIVDKVRIQADFSQGNNRSSQEAETYILGSLADAVRPLLDKHTSAFALGFPGFFIGDSGVLASSPNIPQLRDFSLAEKLSDKLNLPVTAQNDALCAAVGEAWFGAGKGKKNLLHITLGTGIGGGLILNNTPYTGEAGMAMEFGHLRVAYGHEARSCGCGGQGCVEAYASATAISTRYAEATGQHINTKTIFERAKYGENEAQAIFASAGNNLGTAIAEAIKLLDIHTVTISGGLIGAWDFLHPNIMSSLDNNLIPPLKGTIQVLASTLDDNAGLLGAATLARNL